MFEKTLVKRNFVSLFVAVLLLSSTFAVLAANTQVNAQQSAELTAVTSAFLSVRPTAIGVGQEALVNVWFSPAPGANRQFHGFTVTFVDPDGKEYPYTMDTYVADGTMWMPWVFDKVGVWTVKLDYPGEYFEPGRYFNGVIDYDTPDTAGNTFSRPTIYDGVHITASSARMTVNVQEEMIPSWTESPLPTDYWTRPVDEINREWWPILGSYPWFGPAINSPLWDMLYPDTNPTYNSAYAFIPWVSGPESAHIAWKREYALSGLMGGDYGGASHVASGLGTYRQAPTIILMGRAYHSYTKVAENGPGAQTYWECYDIRTGEVFWERPLYAGETAPTLIEWTSGQDEVVGGLQKPTAPVLLSISNGYLRKYNPFTGVMTANVSIAPMTGAGGTYYMNDYVLGIQDLGADAGAERYRLINWTTAGSGAFASRVISNTTYARSALPTEQLIDWNMGIGCTVTSISQGGIFTSMNLTAFNLYTGKTLWNKVIDEPLYSNTANVADHGKLAVISANGYYLAFDLEKGNEVWRTRTLDYPWDASGWGSYSVVSGYGQLYWDAQTGVYAIDWATGKINWKFEKEAPPFETPYTGSEGQPVYPLVNAGICADGKLYLYSNKHTPEAPFYRGMPTLCIDVFTGEEVWSIGLSGGSDMRRTEVQLAIADGYLATAGRDGYLYVFGKGLSETTVSAPQLPLVLGQKALVTGTVLDLSPAQFGAACVNKDSVAAQMEQIHLQASVGGIYGNVTLVGVPVSIDVFDPNGNYAHIATITSDGYSGTFGYSDWIPEVAGQYTITATFMGDESYGSSFATTYIVVAEGSSASNDSGADNTVIYALIGSTVAIIIVMIVCFLLFRKK